MSSLRELAREVSELADRYDAVMALDEAALADLHRRAEAFDSAGANCGWNCPSRRVPTMREYDVEKCACGACKLVSDHSSLPWEWAAWGARKLNYCPSCGTRVGIDERGPWREAMVSRAALMKLAWQYHAHVLLLCASDEEIAESEEVWLEHLAGVGIDGAALKAPEEAMVPREALEWLAGEMADFCSCCGEDAIPQTWIVAALKAAEEADSDGKDA